jgi:hypothetical protein
MLPNIETSAGQLLKDLQFLELWFDGFWSLQAAHAKITRNHMLCRHLCLSPSMRFAFLIQQDSKLRNSPALRCPRR